MKNREARRKVLAAISIGLSTALTLLPTVTVYADEPDPGEDNNTTSEETSQNNSNESEENNEIKESVSEAQESVEAASDAVEAAVGIQADGTAENADSSYDASMISDLNDASDGLDVAAQDLSVLDMANFAVEESNDEYKDAVEVAEHSVGWAEEKVDEVDKESDEISDSVDASYKDTSSRSDSVSIASNKTYDSEAEAQAAKGTALSMIDDTRKEIDENTKKMEVAEKNVENAALALQQANSAVEAAEARKAEADIAEINARHKLEKLLKDNGIPFTEEDGKIIVSEGVDSESGIQAAVTAAKSAYDKAVQESQQAEDALAQANSTAYNNVQALVTAADEKANTAKATYDELSGNFQRDEDLEDLLSLISQKKETIAEHVAARQDGTKADDTYWNENRTLAYYMAKYMLFQRDDVERSSITTSFDKNGYVIKKSNSVKAVEIQYKLKGSDEIQYMYIDYKAMYRDGEVVNTKGRQDLVDADHIIIIEKEVSARNADGSAKSLSSTGDTVFLNEKTFDLANDPYRSAKTKIAKAAEDLIVANKEKEAADAMVANYANLDKATETLVQISGQLETAKAAHTEDSRMNDLLSLIKSQEDVIRTTCSPNKANDYWTKARVLAQYLTEYQLRLDSSVDASSIEFVKDAKGNVQWTEFGTVTREHHCTVTYKLKGSDELQTAYIDYIAYYDNEEVAATSGSFNDLKKVGEVPSHIVVVKKIVKDSTDGSVVFVNKGENLIREQDIIDGTDRYQAEKNLIAGLEAKKTAAESAVNVAKNLQDLRAKVEEASRLQGIIKSAKDDVDKAAEDLRQAKLVLATSATELQTLKSRYNAAKEKYDEVLKEYEFTKLQIEETQTMLNDMLDMLDDGFQYRLPSETSDTDAEASSEGAEEDSSGSPDAEAPFATVYGSVPTTTVESLGFEDLSGMSESSVTPFAPVGDITTMPSLEPDVLEAGVAGERKAPESNKKQPVKTVNSIIKELKNEKGITQSFWWILLAALIGATGKATHDIRKERKPARK